MFFVFDPDCSRIVDFFFLNGFVAMYYRGAAAAIIVYDITRSNTYKTLKSWVEELKNQGPKDIAIAIAGNKADLEEQRVCCH